MIDYIKAIIIGVITGIAAPLPISSSGHFYVVADFIDFLHNRESLTFYYSVFTFIFSLVVFLSFKKEYIKTFKRTASNQKSYKLRFNNLLLSIISVLIVFIPIPGLKKSLSYFFESFMSKDSYLNPILIGLSGIISGMILIISLWYRKNTNSKGKKNVSMKKSIRMYIYSLPGYIIPGASKISLGCANLILSDVNMSVVLRETYFYTAPATLIFSIVKILTLILKGVYPEPLILVCGIVSALLSSSLTVFILRKIAVNKFYVVFGLYSIAFGIIIAVNTFSELYTGM